MKDNADDETTERRHHFARISSATARQFTAPEPGESTLNDTTVPMIAVGLALRSAAHESVVVGVARLPEAIKSVDVGWPLAE
jgi:hypothetical protein